MVDPKILVAHVRKRPHCRSGNFGVSFMDQPGQQRDGGDSVVILETVARWVRKSTPLVPGLRVLFINERKITSVDEAWEAVHDNAHGPFVEIVVEGEVLVGLLNEKRKTGVDHQRLGFQMVQHETGFMEVSWVDLENCIFPSLKRGQMLVAVNGHTARTVDKTKRLLRSSNKKLTLTTRDNNDSDSQTVHSDRKSRDIQWGKKSDKERIPGKRRSRRNRENRQEHSSYWSGRGRASSTKSSDTPIMTGSYSFGTDFASAFPVVEDDESASKGEMMSVQVVEDPSSVSPMYAASTEDDNVIKKDSIKDKQGETTGMKSDLNFKSAIVVALQLLREARKKKREASEMSVDNEIRSRGEREAQMMTSRAAKLFMQASELADAEDRKPMDVINILNNSSFIAADDRRTPAEAFVSSNASVIDCVSSTGQTSPHHGSPRSLTKPSWIMEAEMLALSQRTDPRTRAARGMCSTSPDFDQHMMDISKFLSDAPMVAEESIVSFHSESLDVTNNEPSTSSRNVRPKVGHILHQADHLGAMLDKKLMSLAYIAIDLEDLRAETEAQWRVSGNVECSTGLYRRYQEVQVKLMEVLHYSKQQSHLLRRENADRSSIESMSETTSEEQEVCPSPLMLHPNAIGTQEMINVVQHREVLSTPLGKQEGKEEFATPATLEETMVVSVTSSCQDDNLHTDLDLVPQLERELFESHGDLQAVRKELAFSRQEVRQLKFANLWTMWEAMSTMRKEVDQ